MSARKEDFLALAGAFSQLEPAREVARALSAALYEDARPGRDDLPFRALVVAVTDDLETLAAVADVGCYVVCQRAIRPGRAAVYGLFPMCRKPDLSRAEADGHWRDVHGPLALEHHAAMTHYLQLAVLDVLSGTPYDGFALCGFGSVDDLRERFFTTAESRGVIQADVRRFADVERSPRRLLATATDFAGARQDP
ncbi:MAG: EthD domain-containing protein [Pseudomonadales bacterium]